MVFEKDPYALGQKIETEIAKVMGEYAKKLFIDYAQSLNDTTKNNAIALLNLAEECIKKAGNYKILRMLKI
ncbi:MAG: hypothetical protein NZ942_01715 [Candidatus Aenigmarchaeota archaeon]|nr:hypothetical protein [Candidatus Aenigmarchaeota archaeon]